ncbi:efflux RND transporter periplasmic adaptor subunit [Paracnuella aquatica]|uniref:efflux RND transporter periplasmic adaptor subunit n=1 Tax=Paracnuella aquatica TaxID=2268757 RepID=UPI000DEFD75F|nr:efflux RND transporter periplasmic adaptor subunit [Paracnuella aquatica]RPD48138.1 efflux RND transporter periplasmic adaptor subunit [Paracnuella aquatica]
MNRIITALLLAIIVASCGNAKKDTEGNINDKKVQLEKLRKEQKELTAQIDALEKEVGDADPATAAAQNAKLVTLSPIQPADFVHYVDLQGRVDATNISYVAPPNGQGGVVTALYVKQGDAVRKGQVLARLDDQLIRQQIEPLRVQLTTAEDTYKRTKNLFDQGIGTYQQVLTAQTQVETLRKQIGILQKQAGLMTVTAPSSGVADAVNVRVGELFTGTSVAGPQIRIVNTGSLKITAEVPENYIGRIGKGSKLQVELPDVDKRFETKVNVAGQTIDAARRTFYIEAPVPSGAGLKPNQVASVKVQDYTRTGAVTIPVNTLQNDDKGKYVMVAIKEGDRMIARKIYVQVGELYQNQLEVKSGLQGGEQLIIDGFQSLYDGQPIKTA